MLQEVDRLTRSDGEALDDIVLCGTLLLEPMMEACGPARDRVEQAGEFLEPVVDRLNVPRRIADALRRIVSVLPKLEQGKAARFRRTPLSVLADQVLAINRAARSDSMHQGPRSSRMASPQRKRRVAKNGKDGA